MTSNLTLPVSDFLAASGERWPITEAMTLSEEDRGALRDQISLTLRIGEVHLKMGRKERAGVHFALAARLQSKLDAAQVKP